MTLARGRAALAAVALTLTPAIAVVAVDRAQRPTPRYEALLHALDGSLRATHARQESVAEALARAEATPDEGMLPTLRSAQRVGAQGSVIARRVFVTAPPECPSRVIERPTTTPDVRLVAVFDDDCEALAAMGEARSLSRRTDERAPWAAALAALAGAAVAGLVAWRVSDASARRVGALSAAAARVGAGDLTARVRPGGDDALDALALAFNQMVEEIALSRERVDYLQRLAGWQDIARRLAHEIKNPLTPIQLAVQEVARRYAGDDARFKRTLDTAREVVEEEVATLRRLVTAFSEFARLPEVKPAAGDLAEFVRDMASARQFLDEAAGDDAKGVTAHFEAGDEPVPVMIDRIMLRRAFENLVRNAAQAIGARGGNIWVRAERRRVTLTTEGGASEEVDQARLVVEDDGPGVPREQQAKVFDPYFTTKSDGTGLGLAIVRKIAIDHAGDVGLEDRPGGGARLVIALPLRDPSRRPRRSFVTFTRDG